MNCALASYPIWGTFYCKKIMSPDFKFWKALVLVLLLHSVVIPSSVCIAQQPVSHQPVFSARQAVAGLRPLRLGEHRSLNCLIATRNSSSPLIELSDRNNPIIVAQAAHDAAIEALTSLGWQRNAAVTPAGARRVGNLLQNSFRISINGVPVRDAGLSVIIGALNGKLMAVSSTSAAMQTNAVIPSIGTETVASNLAQYLGDDKNTPVTSASRPVLIYVYSPRFRGLRLAYEMTVRQSSPPHDWRITVDAATGNLLEKKEMLEFV